MHRNAERVQEALAALGATGRVVEFAESTRTSAEAAAAIGTTLPQIAKSLLFMAAGEPVMVIASGVNRVCVTKLGLLCGEPVARADGAMVRQVTGFPIGGVPPVGLATSVRVLLDQDLLKFAEIWSAAGTPHAVFPTTPDELIRITGGRVVDIREE